MPVFNINDFKGIIDDHNKELATTLRSWKRQFSTVASDLTAFFLEDYPQDPAWRRYWDRHSNNIKAILANSSGTGGARVFDPWNGWWSGIWNTAPGETQHHIWDVSTAQHAKVSGGARTQHIQPVTQSKKRFVDGTGLAAALAKNEVDLAINVWSSTDGVTGWVKRYQDNNKGADWKHVGYTLNPHTLLWITQNPADTSRFLMFFEWVTADGRTYGIHGRSFSLQGGRLQRGGEIGWTRGYTKSRDVR